MSNHQIQEPARRRLVVLGTILGLMALQVLVAMVALTGCERSAPKGDPATAQAPATSGSPTPVNLGGGSAAPGSDQASNSPRIDPKPIPPPARDEDKAPLRRTLVPQGTSITLKLETALSTKTTQVGDPFEASVSAPVSVAGVTAVPAGARVAGRVILCDQPGKASGRGKMQLAFDKLTFDGHSYELGSRSAIFQSRSGAKTDREVIGGGAAAGAVVGGILGGNLGSAAKGAVIGGAAGAGVSLMTRGPQLEFAPGTKIRFLLDQPVEVRVAATS